jgi:hypothetical protein
MTLASQILALLTRLDRAQVAAMTPAARQQLAHECLRVLQTITALPAQGPRSGVLADLKDGRPD